MSEDLKAEWARVQARFKIREEAWDRMVARHELERAMVRDDLIAAGRAMDRFRADHPDIVAEEG